MPGCDDLGLPWKQNVSRLKHKLFEGRHRTCTMAIGPGLGRRPNIDELVIELMVHWPNPLVVDADALNVLADNPTSWQRIESHGEKRSRHPRVLTLTLGSGVASAEYLRPKR